jgi:hypothetical protein
VESDRCTARQADYDSHRRCGEKFKVSPRASEAGPSMAGKILRDGPREGGSVGRLADEHASFVSGRPLRFALKGLRSGDGQRQSITPRPNATS